MLVRKGKRVFSRIPRPIEAMGMGEIRDVDEYNQIVCHVVLEGDHLIFFHVRTGYLIFFLHRDISNYFLFLYDGRFFGALHCRSDGEGALFGL